MLCGFLTVLEKFRLLKILGTVFLHRLTSPSQALTAFVWICSFLSELLKTFNIERIKYS